LPKYITAALCKSYIKSYKLYEEVETRKYLWPCQINFNLTAVLDFTVGDYSN
jgi:hypothetical protein